MGAVVRGRSATTLITPTVPDSQASHSSTTCSRTGAWSFDDIYAWEQTEANPSDWWKSVPASVRHKIRFYNTRVEELPLDASASGVLAGDASFLRMLPLAASPSDFVVVKIDIDGGPEMEIVHAIASRPEISKLIDELFFEYHFKELGLNSFWGSSVVEGTNVDTAILLMSRLRQLGIRAHFWI